MTFQNSLIQYLLNKLNTNTQNIVFKGGEFIQQSNTKFEFKAYPTYYSPGVTTEYVPIMFDTTNTPKNIPNLDLYDWTIDVTFALTGEQETDLTNQLNAIEELRKDLINNPTDIIINNGDNYKIITSATNVSKTSDIIILSGEKRIFIAMQIFIQSGISIHFGNEPIYELKEINDSFEIINPISVDFLLGKGLETNQTLTENNTQSLAINKSREIVIIIYQSDLTVIDKILNDIYGNGNMNTIYNFKFKFRPTDTYVERIVLLESGNISTKLGGINILTLKFKDSI